jgi:hypothetical protein
MRARSMVLAALGAAFVLTAVTPAFAHDGWRRRGWHGDSWREHVWREQQWRRHELWERRPHYGYYGGIPFRPPVGYDYYGPPPVYYAVPGLRFGFTVR